MRFTVETKALTTAMATAAAIVERRNTIPILSNVLIEAGTDTISLKATDLDMDLALSIPAKMEKSGATTVPARLLSDIVRKLPAGSELSFDTEKDDQMAVIKSGRSRFQLQTLPQSDFPEITVQGFSHTFEMPGGALLDLLERVQFAISTEETRYYLNGIFLHIHDGVKLRSVSTDGHRLARNEMDAPSGTEGMPGIIIPRKTVGEIIGLAKDFKDAPVAIELSDTKIKFDLGGTVLISKLIDGTFPDYQRVIPQSNNIFALMDSKMLADAADRVSTVSSERGRAVKLSMAAGQCTLAVNNPDMGSAVEEIEASYDAPPLEVGFNVNYLRTALDVLGSGETKFWLQDGGSPTIITNAKVPDLLVVLMPMRV